MRACAGIIAAQTLMFNLQSSVQTLTVGNAIGYGVAMASRNAGVRDCHWPAVPGDRPGDRRRCACSPETSYRILAVSLALLLPAMMSITVSIFQVMRASIAAAETSGRLAERMQILARTDVVTGLANRAGAQPRHGRTARGAARDRKLAMFWLDLDRFKEVNDTLGHPIGDKVLGRRRHPAARDRPRGGLPRALRRRRVHRRDRGRRSRGERTAGARAQRPRSGARPGSTATGSTPPARWASRCCPTTAPTSTR
jgi:hypothetical protein